MRRIGPLIFYADVFLSDRRALACSCWQSSRGRSVKGGKAVIGCVRSVDVARKGLNEGAHRYQKNVASFPRYWVKAVLQIGRVITCQNRGRARRLCGATWPDTSFTWLPLG